MANILSEGPLIKTHYQGTESWVHSGVPAASANRNSFTFQ